MRQPEHACALLVDHHARLVLQLRPGWSRYAPGRLACFGGKREDGEDAVGCLRRELAEETGWSPSMPTAPTVDLLVAGRWVARFFPLPLPATAILRPEAGSTILRADARTLPRLPLSPWHAAAIAGWRSGRRKVALPA